MRGAGSRARATAPIAEYLLPLGSLVLCLDEYRTCSSGPPLDARFPALWSFPPTGMDAFLPAGVGSIVSSKLWRDHAAVVGWLSRLAAGRGLSAVHPRRGDGVLRCEAQRERDQYCSQV